MYVHMCICVVLCRMPRAVIPFAALGVVILYFFLHFVIAVHTWMSKHGIGGYYHRLKEIGGVTVDDVAHVDATTMQQDFAIVAIRKVCVCGMLTRHVSARWCECSVVLPYVPHMCSCVWCVWQVRSAGISSREKAKLLELSKRTPPVVPDDPPPPVYTVGTSKQDVRRHRIADNIVRSKIFGLPKVVYDDELEDPIVDDS